MLIQKYSKIWKSDFETLKQILEDSISLVKISVEHIGSTAVPTLDAKAIIDIDLVYYTTTDFELIKSQLVKIGYFHNGNQGIEGREVFKRVKFKNHKILDNITHHLYVCHKDCQELQKHLLFRNYLRNNEIARIEYQNLKYKIATEANQDKKKYAQLKENQAKHFITDIISKAEKEATL